MLLNKKADRTIFNSCLNTNLFRLKKIKKLVFDICRSRVVIRFFSSPPQRPMTSNFEGFSIPDFIHYIYFPILILEKEPVFSLFNVECQTRELLVPFLLRLWYDAFLVGGLNPGPPALEASTLLLGYRGGGYFNYETI